MENMQNETLPLLTYLMERDAERGRSLKAKNTARTRKKRTRKNRVEQESLSSQAVDYIRDITRGDQLMYENIQRDYPIQMWKGFYEHATAQLASTQSFFYS